MDDSSINFFDRSVNHHCYSEIEAQYLDPSLRISVALKKLRDQKPQTSSANVSIRVSRESICSKKSKGKK